MARRRFVRPAPRTKMWIGAGVGETTIAASAKVLVSSLSAGALLLRPFTILRSRILLNYFTDQAVGDENAEGFYAALVVTETAAALGATVLPDPSGTDGDPEADWFVYQPCFTHFEFADATGFQLGGDSVYSIDSKAMRKVGPDDDVVTMFSQVNASGSKIVDGGRTLIQLH